MNKQRWLTLVVLVVLLVATSPKPALSSPLAPSITSLSPASALAGGPAFTLTVNGSGFIADATVRWHGSNRTTTFVSSTQLTASINAADIAFSGTKNVDVFQSGGSVISNSKPFTINNPVPTITSLSPASTTAGGPAFTLTVNGTNFVSASAVLWDGSSRTVTYVSSTQLTVSISAADIATAGTASVTVFNSAPGGGPSNPMPFTFNNPLPTITSLSPASATVGGSAFTLTVNGTGFLNGVSTVHWNGTTRPTTFVSSTQLTASISAADIATVGTAKVTVLNSAPGGGTSNIETFTINNPVPTITSLSPASATAGGSGFILTVNGTGFVNGASTARWNGSDRTTTYVSSTQLTASISAADIATAGTAGVTVFTASGGGTSNTETFTINNPIPTITSLSPASATAGGSAFTLTVNGTDFVDGASTVRWNGSDRATTYVSSTQLTASISAADIATGGNASVTVLNSAPGGGTSNTETFTINNPVPTITSLSPASATAGGSAFTLTVNGTGFVDGASTVRWNGTDRATTYVSSTQLTASISAADIAAGGTAGVTVLNSAPGGGTSNAMTFTIDDSHVYIYLPLTLNNYSSTPLGIHGQVKQNGLNASGVPLDLRFYDGSSYSTLMSTTTASDGTFQFIDVPSLNPGQTYFVGYSNLLGESGRLWMWGTRELDSYILGSDVDIGTFDIADIPLVSPADTVTVSLPQVFQWTRRSATTNDSYEWNLFDPDDLDPWWWTDPALGYVDNYTFNSLPTGFSTGTEYAWEVWVYSPDGGYGISYDVRSISFSNSGLAPQELSRDVSSKRLLDPLLR